MITNLSKKRAHAIQVKRDIKRVMERKLQNEETLPHGVVGLYNDYLDAAASLDTLINTLSICDEPKIIRQKVKRTLNYHLEIALTRGGVQQPIGGQFISYLREVLA